MLGKLNRKIVTAFVFIILVSLFGLLMSMEYNRAIEREKEALKIHLEHIEEDVDTLFSQRLFNLKGFIPHIQMNPDLTQAEFGEYAKLLLSEDDIVIKDITLAQDTTITHFYPIEGNEAIAGVDVAKLEGQTKKVLLAKNSGETVIDGPFPIVEGGLGIICRIPFDYYPEPDVKAYYGQLNYVVNFSAFLDETGISEALENYHLRIDQIDVIDGAEVLLISNYDGFSEESVTNTLQLPSANWRFTIEKKEGYSGFSLFFILLAVAGILIVSLAMYSINIILKSRDALEASIDELEKTQEKLVLSEKLAALGNLTANVAHEINTPLGNSISLTSYVYKKHEALKEKFEAGTLSKKDLETLFQSSHDTYEMVSRNLSKMVSLVENFKLLTFDSQISELRVLELDQFILNLLNELKMSESLSLSVDCHIESMKVFTDPVAITNIISNLFRNSIAHGFDVTTDRKIFVKGYRDDQTGQVLIRYSDNGIGFNGDTIQHIFTPFYSTKKHKGHTGLGLHIVYNAVVNVLGGNIELVKTDEGLDEFVISFPDTSK